MKVYVYGKCSTCRDALKFLEQNNVVFTTVEITVQPPSIAELKHMLKYQDGNIRKLFNTSGNLYKEMELSKKLDELSLDEAFELLTKHGMLVKRPFVLGKDFGLTGFNKKEWADRFQ